MSESSTSSGSSATFSGESDGSTDRVASESNAPTQPPVLSEVPAADQPVSLPMMETRLSDFQGSILQALHVDLRRYMRSLLPSVVTP